MSFEFDDLERITFGSMPDAIKLLAPYHCGGEAYVNLPEAQQGGVDLTRPVRADDPSVFQFLTLAFYDVHGKPPKHRAELRPWIDMIHALARTVPPRPPEASAKEETLFRVTLDYARIVRGIVKEPRAMHQSLVAHAQRFRLLQPGDELPASEDTLTGMLHKIQPRLAAAGVLVESGSKNGRRFIAIKFVTSAGSITTKENAPDASTPPDTPPPSEACDATTTGAEESAASDTNSAEIARARLRARRKE